MNRRPDKSRQEAPAQIADSPKEKWTPTSDELATILYNHRRWLRSKGKEGKQANLEKAQLQRLDLVGVQLQEANLVGAQLQGAELIRAQLQRATLTGAQLQGANLKGAQLQGAFLVEAQMQGAYLKYAELQGAQLNDVNMEGDEYAGLEPARLSLANLRETWLENAQLSTVTGLEANALGGATLLRAKLPSEIAEFKTLGTVADISARARVLFLSTIAACVYSWLTIATTTDAALITNTGSTPLPIIQTPIPIAWFYWVAPLILLLLYFYLHLYLQSLWEGLASLPAIFPSGRTLYEEAYPWLLSSLVLGFVPRLKQDKSVLNPVRGLKQEKVFDPRPTLWKMKVVLSIFAAWLLVPATIAGYWIRYLPRHDCGGTIAITIFFAAALIGCTAFLRRAVSTLRDGDARSLRGKPFPEVAAAFFSVIVVAPIAFWAFVGPRPFNVGFLRSFADLRNAELSKRPNDWWKLAPDLVLKGVTGARLAGSDLRFAQAEGAFLAKADLSDANMEGANLLRTSLQGANLEGANLMNSSVTEMELESACGNEKTLLPEGLKIEFCSDRDLSKKSE